MADKKKRIEVWRVVDFSDRGSVTAEGNICPGPHVIKLSLINLFVFS